MFCQKCGTALPADSRFCPKCGTAVISGVSQPVPTYVPVAPAYVPPAPRLPQVTSDHPVVAAIKRLGRSPLFLVVTILYTLVQMFNMLQYLDMLSASSVYGMDGFLSYSGVTVASNVGMPFVLLGMVFGILTMSGLWMIYGASVSKRSRAGTAGLTMIFVVQLITMILLCLVLGIALIAVLVALGTAMGYGANESFVLLPFALIGGITALVLVYYVKLFGTIAKIKTSLRTGVPKQISGFVAVMCFIGGVVGMVSSMMSLADSMPYLRWMSTYALISMVAGFVGNFIPVIFGVLIFVYKSMMRKFLVAPVVKTDYVEYVPVTPVVETPAPVAPVVETPVEEVPVEVVPVLETPVEEVAVEETPVVEIVSVEESAPVVEDPVEIASVVEEAVPAEPVSEEQ